MTQSLQFPTRTGPIRVLIVDDSALVREMLATILNEDPAIEVVGTAGDPLIARDKIKQLKPDLLTLDVEMPRMDGITFLRNLMRLHPLPVVMISSLTEKGAQITLTALELGAVDFVSKPRIGVASGLLEYADEIRTKVKMAARARLRSNIAAGSSERPVLGSLGFHATERIVAIGASTGGTEAIKEVLQGLPADAPAIVIAQHIPESFSGAFAKRMDGVSEMSVCEASDRQPILPGHAYIAPGNRHLRVERDGARYRCRLDDGEPVNRHKPSVEVLFNSVAQCVGRNAVGIMLTGMGKDGAQGLLNMRNAGAHTIAQDEASSVVWGMPGEAVHLGAAVEVVSLTQVAAHLLRSIRETR